MIYSESRYCRINRLLASLIGVWPYQDVAIMRIRACAVLLLLTTGILNQLAAFVTHEFSINLLLRIVSCIVPKLIYILKYVTYFVNTVEVKYIIEWIQKDWNTLVGEKEYEIIERYANYGITVTVIFTSLVYSGVFAFIVCPFVPKILDILMPSNESRSLKFPILVEYFVEQEKYFYVFLLHIDICDLVGGTIVIATEATSGVFIQHACGLFKVTSHRFECAVEDSINNILQPEMHVSLHGQLRSVVEMHQRALKFTDFINDTFAKYYFLLLSISVVSLSINLFIFTKSILVMDMTYELLVATILVIVHFGYMFCCNFMGQDIMDHSYEVFTETYNTRWYIAPLPVRKLLLFIMQRSIKASCFVTGGIYTPSFEGFSALVSTSLSYFMVLYSTN